VCDAAVLGGRRLDVKEGERLVVRGVLRVTRHKGEVANGVERVAVQRGRRLDGRI
jgi:hypothetical protein